LLSNFQNCVAVVFSLVYNFVKERKIIDFFIQKSIIIIITITIAVTTPTP
jgi:hypothetical protein